MSVPVLFASIALNSLFLVDTVVLWLFSGEFTSFGCAMGV